MVFENFKALRVAGRVLAGAAAALLATAASATTITTTSFTTWKSSGYQTGSPTELNFMTINSSSYNTAAGITLLPTSGSTPTFTFTGLDNGAYWLAGDIYSKTLAGSTDSGAYLNVAFSAPQNAFLLGFGNNSGLTYTLTLSDGETFSTTSKLFGFSLSHGISSLTVATTPGVQAVVNDFWFGTSSLTQDQGGTPAPTPEPATLLLIASGGLLLIGARRSKRSAAE